jgi:purine-binding chemotaxis protein CheW
VFSLRGDIVPVIDLGVLLGLARTEAGDASRIVVVDKDGTTIGIVVDRLRDLRMLDAALEPAPPSLSPTIAQMLLGIAATPTGTVRVLDAGAIVSADELRALSRTESEPLADKEGRTT